MKDELYKEIAPCIELEDLVDSFWMHANPTDNTQIVTISASSFVKFVVFVRKRKIIYYILTGVWTEPKEIHVPPETAAYGCRMKVLAPEFLLNREMTSLCNIMHPLEHSFLNVEKFEFTDFKTTVKHFEYELLKIKSTKKIADNKARFSDLLYSYKGSISTKEVAEQVFWTNRQINRYLNSYIGIPLKKFLTIQKCSEIVSGIVLGKYSPYDSFYDQAHFIREVKKHTGATPTKISKLKNDRFIQLTNISKK
jgi:hypothetical protein